MEFLQRIGIQQHHLITFLHYTNILQTFLSAVFKQSVKTSSYVLESFKPETYCFFNNQYVAVRANEYNLSDATSPRVAYYFEKDSGFYKNGSEFSTSRLNILSAYLYHHNLRVADLSEFFYTTTYESSERIPQLGYWMAAWQLKQKVFLDVSKHFTLHIMTVLGQRVILDYDPNSEECQQAWAALNSNIRHMNQRTFIGDDTNSESEEESEEEVIESQNITSTTTTMVDASTQKENQSKVDASTQTESSTMVDASTQTESPTIVDGSTQSESTENKSTEVQ
jgi:hypothetical protein